VEPRQQGNGTHNHTQFDATKTRGTRFASSILSSGSWALLMMPFSLVAPEIDKGTFDGRHNGRLTVPNLLLITSGRPAEID